MVQGHMKMHLGNISLFLVAALLLSFAPIGSGTAMAATTEVTQPAGTADFSNGEVTVTASFTVEPDTIANFDAIWLKVMYWSGSGYPNEAFEISSYSVAGDVYSVSGAVYDLVYLPATYQNTDIPVTARLVYEDDILTAVYLEVTVPPPQTGGGGGGGPTTPPPAPPVILGSASQPIVVGQETTVELTGGPWLTIPAGATQSAGTVTLAAVQDDQVPALGTNLFRVAGQAFEVTIVDEDGTPVTSFNLPLELTFQVSADQLSEGATASELWVFYYDTDLNKWLPVPTTVNVATGEVKATFSHLTLFAVLVNRQFQPMTDTTGHWADEYVLRLVSLGTVNGVGQNRFAPEAQVTRAEFAKMLVSAAGKKPALTAPGYTDVNQIPEWALGYVQTATLFGWLKGDAAGTFRPNDPITREEIATVIARVTSGPEAGTVDFTDAAEISDWAQGGVFEASRVGIITGYPDGSFRPKATATRAESSTMIWRLVKALARE